MPVVAARAYSKLRRPKPLDPYLTVKLVLLAFFFALSGFFACSEASLFSLTALHIHKMREEHYPFLSLTQRLLEQPRRLLTTIIVSNEIANILISTIMTGIFIHLLGERGTWVAIAVTTPLLTIFAEAIPKTFAKTLPMRFASLTVPIVVFFSWLSHPLLAAVDGLWERIVGPFRKGDQRREGMSEGEFRTLINVGHDEGILERAQRDLIHRVFELGDTEVGEIMTPRVDMFCLPLSLNIQGVMTEVIRHGYSRVPVYEGDADNIVGILYAKDLLAGFPGLDEQVPLSTLLKKPYFIPLEKSAESVLRDFQFKKIHLAVVVDEYGGVAGLVTMEDILESLFGDIYDERDTREKLYHAINDHTFVVLGMMTIEQFNELVGASLSSEDYDTLGGYVLHLFGTLPAKGQTVFDATHSYRVEKMTKARIVRVRVSKREPSDG